MKLKDGLFVYQIGGICFYGVFFIKGIYCFVCCSFDGNMVLFVVEKFGYNSLYFGNKGIDFGLFGNNCVVDIDYMIFLFSNEVYYFFC